MIDWNFIGEREGRRLQGYVPAAGSSNSGVTVASGVDLGQLRWPLWIDILPSLAALLRPYLGLRGEDAIAFLKSHPLIVTDDEANYLDEVSRATDVAALGAAYLRDAGTALSALPSAAQTVLASVTFQYGTPWVRTPHFWGAAVQKNWVAAEDILRNFGDEYQPRHDLEADYLRDNLGKG